MFRLFFHSWADFPPGKSQANSLRREFKLASCSILFQWHNSIFPGHIRNFSILVSNGYYRLPQKKKSRWDNQKKSKKKDTRRENDRE
jgi:hypothetical protein